MAQPDCLRLVYGESRMLVAAHYLGLCMALAAVGFAPLLPGWKLAAAFVLLSAQGILAMRAPRHWQDDGKIEGRGLYAVGLIIDGAYGFSALRSGFKNL